MNGESTIDSVRDGLIDGDLIEMSMTILKTLSDPARLQMLWALSRQDHSLSELAQLIGVSPTVASQLLGRLRSAGVLQTRKDGRHVIYSMHDERSREFIGHTLDFAQHRLDWDAKSEDSR